MTYNSWYILIESTDLSVIIISNLELAMYFTNDVGRAYSKAFNNNNFVTLSQEWELFPRNYHTL